MLLNKKSQLDSTFLKYKKIELLFDEAMKTSYDIFLKYFKDNIEFGNYVYDSFEAEEELGLGKELVLQLVDDYISQVLNSVCQFYEFIEENNFSELKNLAHKNLGVAKNLRIQDATIILNDLMKKDDVEYLKKCVDALESCSYKLNPIHAYSVLELIELKNSCYRAL